MKKISGIALFLIISVSLFSQQSFELKNDDFSVEYQVDSGKLHGKYVSYYPNGKKKAEGEFYKNQRIGIWTMWSQEGDELLQRDYANNFVFLYPDGEFDDLDYVPYRNESDCFDYFELHEQDVLFSLRLMTVITKDNNSYLFSSNDFLTLLSENQDNKAFQQIKIHDEFSVKPMDLPEVASSEIIAYKLLQEAVYDSKRQVLEIRPVFIFPVIYNRVEQSIYEGNSLSYQLIYPYMNEIAVAVDESEMEIFSMADVFFWQYYNFKVVTLNNDRFSWSDNLDTIVSELFNSEGELKESFLSDSWNNRIKLIETEHDLWAKYSLTE